MTGTEDRRCDDLWVAHAVTEHACDVLSLHLTRDEAVRAVVDSLGREQMLDAFCQAHQDLRDPGDLALLQWWFGPVDVGDDGGMDWGEHWGSSAFVRPAAAPNPSTDSGAPHVRVVREQIAAGTLTWATSAAGLLGRIAWDTSMCWQNGEHGCGAHDGPFPCPVAEAHRHVSWPADFPRPELIDVEPYARVLLARVADVLGDCDSDGEGACYTRERSVRCRVGELREDARALLAAWS